MPLSMVSATSVRLTVNGHDRLAEDPARRRHPRPPAPTRCAEERRPRDRRRSRRGSCRACCRPGREIARAGLIISPTRCRVLRDAAARAAAVRELGRWRMYADDSHSTSAGSIRRRITDCMLLVGAGGLTLAVRTPACESLEGSRYSKASSSRRESDRRGCATALLMEGARSRTCRSRNRDWSRRGRCHSPRACSGGARRLDCQCGRHHIGWTRPTVRPTRAIPPARRPAPCLAHGPTPRRLRPMAIE